MAPSALPPLDKIDPVREWQPWEPDARDPWGLKWAAHLYRRAAFGASLDELRQAVRRGHHATLDLLTGDGLKMRDWLPVQASTGRSAANRNNESELRAWWLYWVLHSLFPLREKMTLFWHNHFATSIAKVRSTRSMLQQNLLLRQHALGKFGPFLQAMSKDHAMLIWLDSNSNIKGRPNENYARELMELFSLGVGHYTEKDIREAARAFTGWHADEKDAGGGRTTYEFVFNPLFHDAGVKTVLGRTGNWNGDDIVRIVLGRPDTARFLVRKLYHFFVSESQEPPDAFLEPLADSFRASDYDIAALVRSMLSSRHFFSGHAFRQRVKSPVEFVLGAVRAVYREYDEKDRGHRDLPPITLVAPIDAMGQALFAPPNVKGWRGGETWLNTSTVLARENFSQVLAMGTLWNGGWNFAGPQTNVAVATAPAAPGRQPDRPEESAPPAAFDPARVVHEEKLTRPADIVRLLLDVHLPGGVAPGVQEKLTAFLEEGKPAGAALDRRVREIVHAILSMPEYQLA
jgi:uncharacterized protein (DUF1800 family)